MNKSPFYILLGGFSLLFSIPVSIAGTVLSYSNAGTTYSQNFNTLTNAFTLPTAGGTIFDFSDPSGINATNMTGWYGNAASKTVYVQDTGTATTGAFYSYSTAGASSDKALGIVTTTTSGPLIFGLGISNDTGSTLTSFTISYDAEHWHNGNSNTSKTLAFGYVVGGGATLPTIAANGTITPASGTYVHEAALDFTKVGVGTAGALDGHATANSANETDTVSNINWAPNTTLWLTWDIATNNAQSPGMGIDNFTFSSAAAPEPSISALFMSGISLVLLVSRRRKVL